MPEKIGQALRNLSYFLRLSKPQRSERARSAHCLSLLKKSPLYGSLTASQTYPRGRQKPTRRLSG